MNPEYLIDFSLVICVLAMACLSLSVKDIFTSIVLFIGLGLLAALAWARLGAWDVAIAEAAIGAGLTGALLLAAWARIAQSNNSGPNDVS